MNYREVLFAYQPLEPGDFMCRYYINNREYIIYSPEKERISCLELSDFTDITPFQLAVSIQKIQTERQEEQKEFTFDKACSKENLIKYLFDIAGDITQYRKKRGVSNCEAYLLYDLKFDKVKNLFHFNPGNNEYQLVFDNDVCIACINDDSKTNTINICWNPVVFKVLEERAEETQTSYLLPSSNPILCAHICKRAHEQSTLINLYGTRNSLYALLFFSYYINNSKMEKKISIFSESTKNYVLMENWNPTTLVRFISRIQKIYNGKVRKIHEEEYDTDIITYQLLSVAGLSFVAFSNDDISIDIFLREVISEYKSNEVFYAEV